MKESTDIEKTDDNETEKADSTKDEKEKIPEVVGDGTGEKKEANGELDKSDCNGHNKTDETVALGAKKASGGSRIVAFFWQNVQAQVRCSCRQERHRRPDRG